MLHYNAILYKQHYKISNTLGIQAKTQFAKILNMTITLNMIPISSKIVYSVTQVIISKLCLTKQIFLFFKIHTIHLVKAKAAVP